MVEHHAAEGEEPAVTLDAFLDQSNATAVRLEPDDDARALIPLSRPAGADRNRLPQISRRARLFLSTHIARGWLYRRIARAG
jgi:hypothetical protein